jgi:hypothetical protein
MLYPRTKIAAEQINGKIYVIGWTDNNGTITILYRFTTLIRTH